MGEFFGKLFVRYFLGEIFWRICWEYFFWEEIFGRNSLFTGLYFSVEGIDLFVKILVFVKILSKSKEGRKEE